jgi:hypothetical protein
MVNSADEHPVFGRLRQGMPGLASKKYPVRNVGKAVVRGIEKRAKAVHVPGWVGALKYFRAFTPMVVDRQAVEEVAAADVEMAKSDTSGLVGPGGQAASR